MEDSVPAPTRPQPKAALPVFLALTFSITWAAIGVFIVAPDTATAIFGEISGAHPLFFLATWSPAIAGLEVVYGMGGLKGVRAFLSRLFMWRGSWAWAAFILADTPRGPVYGHGGWIPGYVSSLRHYADHGVTIAFQINTDISPEGEAPDLAPALEAALADLALTADAAAP